jgi:hypothetical protein
MPFALDKYKKICYNLKKHIFLPRITAGPKAEEFEKYKKLCYNIKKGLAAGRKPWHTSRTISIYKNVASLIYQNFSL